MGEARLGHFLPGSRYLGGVLPAAFRNRRALAILNIGAVATALAAVTVAAFSHMWGARPSAFAVGVPTLLVGAVWAFVLRLPQTVGKSSFRLGWVTSVPLAALNAGIAAAALIAGETGRSFGLGEILGGLILGVLFGAFLWVPALLLTLVCFGLPIAWAQSLAKRGLAGEERGEWIVGLACFAMSALSLLVWGGHDATAAVFARGLSAAGLLLSATSTGLAAARERRRRSFVARVEQGREPGYRIDATDEGKVLMRVQENHAGYRVADFEEEVYELSAEGEATREKHLDPVGR